MVRHPFHCTQCPGHERTPLAGLSLAVYHNLIGRQSIMPSGVWTLDPRNRNAQLLTSHPQIRAEQVACGHRASANCWMCCIKPQTPSHNYKVQALQLPHSKWSDVAQGSDNDKCQSLCMHHDYPETMSIFSQIKAMRRGHMNSQHTKLVGEYTSPV
jgi:hypothetical protein